MSTMSGVVRFSVLYLRGVGGCGAARGRGKPSTVGWQPSSQLRGLCRQV